MLNRMGRNMTCLNTLYYYDSYLFQCYGDGQFRKSLHSTVETKYITRPVKRLSGSLRDGFTYIFVLFCYLGTQGGKFPISPDNQIGYSPQHHLFFGYWCSRSVAPGESHLLRFLRNLPRAALTDSGTAPLPLVPWTRPSLLLKIHSRATSWDKFDKRNNCPVVRRQEWADEIMRGRPPKETHARRQTSRVIVELLLEIQNIKLLINILMVLAQDSNGYRLQQVR